MNRWLLNPGVALGMLFVIAPIVSAKDPLEKEKPVRPLAELVSDLEDSSRQKRYDAADAIREHYAGKCVEVSPKILDALAIELDVPLYPEKHHEGFTQRPIAMV